MNEIERGVDSPQKSSMKSYEIKRSIQRVQEVKKTNKILNAKLKLKRNWDIESLAICFNIFVTNNIDFTKFEQTSKSYQVQPGMYIRPWFNRIFFLWEKLCHRFHKNRPMNCRWNLNLCEALLTCTHFCKEYLRLCNKFQSEKKNLHKIKHWHV